MKKDELNKLIDNGLDRLNEKAKIQKDEANRKALILPGAKTVIKIGVITCLVYLFFIGLYSYDIKAPLFTLVFWSYPLLIAYMMLSTAINYDRDTCTENFFNLLLVYAILGIVGFYFYEKFVLYISSIGYQITIPFINYTLELI
jgi:FtsH-binding integral membrane protein